MPRTIISIDDLTGDEIDRILERTRLFEQTGAAPSGLPRLVGLVFGEASLRTRVGFAAAATKLGWGFVDVFERRHSPTSMPESWEDTLRTLSGYVDVLVVRPGESLPRTVVVANSRVPYINAGGVGQGGEHPTQALIDLYAIERMRGSLSDLTVAICGDLRMRAVQSLLRLFTRRQPRRVIGITVPGLRSPGDVPDGPAVEFREPWQVEDVDVLYVAGIPHLAISEPQRALLRITADTMNHLGPDAIVLSPMPVIDEIDGEARRDPRVRMFEQSDLGLFVRMAVLWEVRDDGSQSLPANQGLWSRPGLGSEVEAHGIEKIG